MGGANRVGFDLNGAVAADGEGEVCGGCISSEVCSKMVSGVSGQAGDCGSSGAPLVIHDAHQFEAQILPGRRQVRVDVAVLAEVGQREGYPLELGAGRLEQS